MRIGRRHARMLDAWSTSWGLGCDSEGSDGYDLQLLRTPTQFADVPVSLREAECYFCNWRIRAQGDLDMNVAHTSPDTEEIQSWDDRASH
jgi:hypothetical protein